MSFSISLKLHGLGFAYGRRQVLSDISLSLAPGTLCHIVGPNGCGKSTLLSVIAGLRKPSAGSVQVSHRKDDGQIYDIGNERRQVLEYLPAEGNGFFPSLSAEENLAFWRQIRQDSLGEAAAAKEAWYAEIDQALLKWGLKASLPHLKLNVGKFSTGMRRRLAMARLQLSPAAIWLLDEPLYGLDIKGIELFSQLLETHRAAGGLTLLVTHDLAPLRLEHALKLELQKGRVGV